MRCNVCLSVNLHNENRKEKSAACVYLFETLVNGSFIAKDKIFLLYIEIEEYIDKC